ncbi:MAG: DUF2291 domain-containing protein [Velocimicrobium sp.]
MKKRLVALCMAVMVAMATMTGCIKIVKIGEEAKLTGEVEFNAGDDVASFWDSKAIPELTEKAVDLGDFLTQANGDLNSLADKYGKYSMGTSGELTYTVKGSGTITAVETDKKAGYMTISLDDYTGSEKINIQVGSVMKGSSVRDALSFIKFGDYTNQGEYASVSQSINSIIMETVINPESASGMKDKNIEFTGCFTVNENDTILITPVTLTEK